VCEDSHIQPLSRTAMLHKNSSGYDGVSNKILRSCGKFLSKPLTYIFNLSLTHGTFPDHLKFCIVSPLFKKGDRSQLSNYRPTSLLTSFSQIFEILIYRRLNQHVQIHNILVPEQFGFRSGMSTCNTIYKLMKLYCLLGIKGNLLPKFF
jgi:hypothetical protein